MKHSPARSRFPSSRTDVPPGECQALEYTHTVEGSGGPFPRFRGSFPPGNAARGGTLKHSPSTRRLPGGECPPRDGERVPKRSSNVIPRTPGAFPPGNATRRAGNEDRRRCGRRETRGMRRAGGGMRRGREGEIRRGGGRRLLTTEDLPAGLATPHGRRPCGAPRLRGGAGRALYPAGRKWRPS